MLGLALGCGSTRSNDDDLFGSASLTAASISAGDGTAGDDAGAANVDAASADNAEEDPKFDDHPFFEQAVGLIDAACDDFVPPADARAPDCRRLPPPSWFVALARACDRMRRTSPRALTPALHR